MITKQPRRTMEFGEQDEDFIKRLAGDIGCYYSKASGRTYNLNKFKSDVQEKKGVFAWVHKEASDYFWVATRKIWVEKARARAMAGKKVSGVKCLPRDTQRAQDSVSFDAKNDYQNTVMALILINKAY